VYQAAREMGWLTAAHDVRHIDFGMVLGDDGKKYKTRSGVSPKLADLLDEGVKRARDTLISKVGVSSPEVATLIVRDVTST